MKKYTVLVLSLIYPLLFFAQVTNQGSPISWKTNLQNIETIILPDFDLQEVQEEDRKADKKGNAPWRFGYEHSVDIGIKSHGTWTNLADGSRYWLLNIQSPEAVTMNFIFNTFYLPKGATLYFYNADKSDVLGAYTHTQNREDKMFGSWLVEGDNIYIELFEPAEKIGKSKLHISKAVHGYRSLNQYYNNFKNLNDSGACNLDVDCPIGNDFDNIKDQLKKSVALLIANGDGFCSGVLVNNTNNDATPYFLTANHCLDNSVANWAFRFNWRSPNPQCASGNSSTNGNFNQTISGANLLANNPNSDFALLEITPTLPTDWDLVWAGWDRSTNQANYSVGIHHPSGDIMKVCRDDSTPDFSNFSGTLTWRVNNWEIGVTEGGSSGSPLFNQDGRIIGQLFGGGAACSGTSNNGLPDYYGRFDVSWDFGNSSNTRLKDWLDPSNTGQSTLDQYPPLQVYNLNASISLSNISSEVCSQEIEPIITINNLGLNTLTSAIITYQLNNNESVLINWSGNLTTGQSEAINTPSLVINDGQNTFTASVSSPNNDTDEFLNNNNINFNFTKNIFVDSSSLFISITTDDWGDETTWTLVDDNGQEIAQGGPYPDNNTINTNVTINPNNCYTFTIFDSAGDGICCLFGNGNFDLSLEDGFTIYSGGNFDFTDSYTFGVSETVSTNTFSQDTIQIHPNPVTDYFHISTTLKNLTFEIYTIHGKMLLSTKNQMIDISNLSSGLYILKIINSDSTFLTHKIVKQ